MKRHTMLLAGCVFAAMGGGAAHADCAEELAAFTGSGSASGGGGTNDGRIAKDGSLAPLQEEGQGGAAAAGQEFTAGQLPETSGQNAQDAEEGGEIAKDGSTAPLQESGEGSEVPLRATSPQEAEAQQMAAADAHGEAVERARQALEAGDEEACLQALEEARG